MTLPASMAYHVGALMQVLRALLSIQLLANDPGKVAEDDLCIYVPVTYVGESDRGLDFWLWTA